MVNKQLREERHHGDISLPVSGYRVQPPYSAHLGELECHWHSEMELFQVERGTMQVQCGSEYFEAKAGDLVFFNSGELHAAQPIHGSELDFAAVVFSPELLCGDENDIVRRRYVAPVVEGKLLLPRVTDSSTPAGRQVVGAFQQVMDLLEPPTSCGCVPSCWRCLPAWLEAPPSAPPSGRAPRPRASRRPLSTSRATTASPSPSASWRS